MAVQVEIKVRNLELSDRLQDYVTKKVSRLDRYLDTLEQATVDLAFVKSARSAQDRQVAQVTVRGRGVLLRAEERTDDIFASVDAALEKIHRQIERYKGRRWRNRGDGRPTAAAAPEAPALAAEAASSEPVIARRKRFLLAPMDELEALEQMSLLAHEDFFVFLNAQTSQINVLYRRRDGTYGLLEPEIG
jgi:putative sigma-54 modulation protein